MPATAGIGSSIVPAWVTSITVHNAGVTSGVQSACVVCACTTLYSLPLNWYLLSFATAIPTAHTGYNSIPVNAVWTPDITPNLWTVIDVTHAGTIDDPIPAVAGMEYVYGKYYIEGKTIYLCKRTGEAEGGTIVLQFLPSQLVGQYFEAVK